MNIYAYKYVRKMRFVNEKELCTKLYSVKKKVAVGKLRKRNDVFCTLA